MTRHNLRAKRHRMVRAPFILSAVLAVVASPALAQAPAPSDAAKAMAGAWEMSNADRDRTCNLIFKLTPAGANYAIELDKACGQAFPATRAIVGWTLGRNDMLLLVDATGAPVLEMLEVEAGTYEGLRPNEGRYVLQNPAVVAASKERPADDLFGEWAIVRAGTTRPLCALTFAGEAADADSFALRVKPGCDQIVARFGPVSWKMDRGQLVVQSAKGQVWRFEENDPNTWDRIPKGREPLALVRQQP
jgi:Protease inhibitor Inh